MQFHLNGFKLGDPGVSEPAGGETTLLSHGLAVDEIDVLIVGCGPAGLTLAAQLAEFPDIKTRIVEQKPARLMLGQADGIACRTMEMFEAYGFSENVLREAYWVNETSFWKPEGTNRQSIVRSGRIQDTEDGLSEFPHVILNQARIHDFLLDKMRNAPSRLEPSYARRLIDLRVDPGLSSPAAYPVTVRLERLDEPNQGQVETIHARFVVGCDGARSAVRTAIGRTLHGDSANQAWGVMDVLAVSDFPDMRLKAAIHSANDGNVLIIPREGGYLVRLYIELDKLDLNERVSNRNITSDTLIAAAQRILRPYTLDVKEVAWWSVYEIGQRLCDRFDDCPELGSQEQEAQARLPRIFIAGDACHTHSPKAGQGMNVSMADAFNLGWKLASVLQRQCKPSLLRSYSTERQAVAKELIDFDREFAKMFSAPPKDPANPDMEGVDTAEFQAYFVKRGRFTAGTAVQYHPSIITGQSTHQTLAEGLVIGMRFHSAPVIRLADAKPLHLGHTIKADGRWRLFAFADTAEPGDRSARISILCRFFAESTNSPIRKFTPAGTDIDSVVDVRVIFQQSHRDVAIDTLPAFLIPQKGRYGLRDYEKVFCPDLRGGNDIFSLRGVDRQHGCVVVVRPDQYVAHVLPLDAFAELAAFFDAFMAVAA